MQAHAAAVAASSRDVINLDCESMTEAKWDFATVCCTKTCHPSHDLHTQPGCGMPIGEVLTLLLGIERQIGAHYDAIFKWDIHSILLQTIIAMLRYLTYFDKGLTIFLYRRAKCD